MPACVIDDVREMCVGLANGVWSTLKKSLNDPSKTSLNNLAATSFVSWFFFKPETRKLAFCKHFQQGRFHFGIELNFLCFMLAEKLWKLLRVCVCAEL